MGPYPFDAPPAAITPANPMGTDGFEFVEFAHPDPAALDRVFRLMGFTPVAKHRSKAVTLYRQGDVNYVVNAEPDSFAGGFAREHGPCACAMAFRVVDAKAAYARAIALGAEPFEGGHVGPNELTIPAIRASAARCSISSTATPATPSTRARSGRSISSGWARPTRSRSPPASITSTT